LATKRIDYIVYKLGIKVGNGEATTEITKDSALGLFLAMRETEDEEPSEELITKSQAVLDMAKANGWPIKVIDASKAEDGDLSGMPTFDEYSLLYVNNVLVDYAVAGSNSAMELHTLLRKAGNHGLPGLIMVRPDTDGNLWRLLYKELEQSDSANNIDRRINATAWQVVDLLIGRKDN